MNYHKALHLGCCSSPRSASGYFQHSNVFETGLSDFHLLTITEFKMGFQKRKLQVITYRNYKKFNNDKFQADIKTYRFDKNDINLFKETILSVFNKYGPIKIYSSK